MAVTPLAVLTGANIDGVKFAALLDHLTPWSEGGTTNPHNGGPAWRHHNNWRYTTGARTRLRTNGSWATHRPDGTDIAPPD